MPRVEGTVEIAAPRQVVWDLLADPRQHTELGTFVAEVTVVTQGEVREGTVYRERSGPGFMKSESEWTISRLDRPRELVHTSKESSMTAEATWTLDEVDGRSTRVTQTLDFEMMPRIRPLGRLLEAVFAKPMTNRETTRMLHDLKRIAESSAATPSQPA
jgi:carbon monoxide dehydrogenase subunit G